MSSRHVSNGKKADNLSTLLEARFNVPRYYIIPYQYKDKLDNQKVIKKLTYEFEQWKSDNRISSVAIRSSSNLEDTTKKSYAGQFLTILDISNSEDFVKAIKAVFNSKQSKSYSVKKGAVNVIVQDFIEPDCSGVIFTVNPATGSDEILINAASGRGTSVVGGLESQHYSISRKNFHISADKKTNLVLNRNNTIKLTKLALNIEKLFSYPQDIEWAIRDKEIFILQARPVTNINHLRLWDSSNIAESFPGIVSPLTFSIARRWYMYGYKSQAHEAGLDWYETENLSRLLNSMIGLFNGRMYYNLLNWYKFISVFPGSARNQKFIDDQIGTQGDAIYFTEGEKKLAFKIKFYFKLIYRTLFFRYELYKFWRVFNNFERELLILPDYDSPQALLNKYTYLEKIVPYFGRTVDNDFFVMTYNGWLKNLIGKWLPNDETAKRSIMGSINGVLSTKQALYLYELAQYFKEDSKACMLINQDKFEELDSYLEDTEIENKIEEYAKLFGHRFAEDQKVESINPTLGKFGLYKLIKPYLFLDVKEVNLRLRDVKENSRATEEMIEKKIKKGQKIIYRFLLRRLKHHLRIREKNRLLRGKIYSHLRELFPRLGRSLADMQILTKEDDIFYLQIDEIYQIVEEGLVVNDFGERIRKRRRAYSKYRKMTMPERFMTTSLPSMIKIERSGIDENQYSSKVNLQGIISSAGTVEGTASVLETPTLPKEPFEILVVRHTDPGWTPIIALAKGVVVEHGGMLSHAAVITRELGIPSIIGVANATSIIKDGMKIRINTQKACLEILEG